MTTKTLMTAMTTVADWEALLQQPLTQSALARTVSSASSHSPASSGAVVWTDCADSAAVHLMLGDGMSCRSIVSTNFRLHRKSDGHGQALLQSWQKRRGV